MKDLAAGEKTYVFAFYTSWPGFKLERIYNDKADSYPQHTGKFFNFRIFIEFFIHEVKKTLKFWVSGPYLYNKYQ